MTNSVRGVNVPGNLSLQVEPLSESSIQSLIKALEEAKGPDRELDMLIQTHLSPRKLIVQDPRSLWNDQFLVDAVRAAKIENAPAYTASIDAAMGLCPDGVPCGFSGPISEKTGVGHVGKFFGMAGSVPDNGFHFAEVGATPAIALCIASFRARAALEGTK